MMDRALALTPPPPPRALTAGAREITDSYGKMRRWMGFFFLGHGGIMTTVFSWGLPVDIALDLDGATVDARITGVDHDTSVKLNKKRATKITYAYTAGGEPHEGSFHTIDPKLTTSIVGARLPLEVWPTLPSWSRAKGQRNCFFGYFVLLLALEPLAGGPLLIAGFLARARARGTWVHGVAVPANVTSVTAGSVRTKNGRTRTQSSKIAWSYGWGPEVRTAAVDTQSTLLKTLQQGHSFTLLVNPDRPGDTVPWRETLQPSGDRVCSTVPCPPRSRFSSTSTITRRTRRIAST